ncbi:MAG: hypothetical protein Q4B96_03460 [Bacillota bacterium]|nr:hypothetical protein [Bacillota bacterium]
MNRAFVKADDGWGFCIQYLDSCMFADENGKCTLAACRFHEGEQPPEQPRQ